MEKWPYKVADETRCPPYSWVSVFCRYLEDRCRARSGALDSTQYSRFKEQDFEENSIVVVRRRIRHRVNGISRKIRDNRTLDTRSMPSIPTSVNNRIEMRRFNHVSGRGRHQDPEDIERAIFCNDWICVLRDDGSDADRELDLAWNSEYD